MAAGITTMETVLLAALVLAAPPASAACFGPPVQAGSGAGFRLQAPAKPNAPAGGEAAPAIRSEPQHESNSREVSAANLKLAEAEADRFVKRLTETLDLKAVLEETVPDPSDRQQIIHRFWSSSPFGDSSRTLEDLDEETMAQAYYAYHNLYLASIFYAVYNAKASETSLGSPEAEIQALPEAVELKETMERISGHDDAPSADGIRAAIPLWNRLAARLREEIKKLDLDPEIRSNIGREAGLEERQSTILNEPAAIGLDPDAEAYAVQRGILLLYFVMKDSKLQPIGLAVFLRSC